MEIPKPHDFRTSRLNHEQTLKAIEGGQLAAKALGDLFVDVEVAAIGASETLKEFGTTVKAIAEKKPYVRKEHLTQRPFLNRELVQFRNSLPKPAPKKQKRGQKK